MQKMNSGVESFSLLAVPLFILAGNIMNNGGIAKAPCQLCAAVCRQDSRLMAQAIILGNMLFGALSRLLCCRCVRHGRLHQPY